MSNRGKERAPIDPSAVHWAVSFLDRFDQPAEKFGIWHEMEKQQDGTFRFAWYEYRQFVTEFMEGLHERHLNVVFDWGKWKCGEKLFFHPNLIAQATAADCLKLITSCVRKDRFCEGFMAQALEQGVIAACLKRLREFYPSE